MVWRPYRTASAKIDSKFLSHLAAIETELQRTAGEEGWQLDWKRHDSLFERARKSLSDRKLSQALRYYASVIDILMAGLQQRRQGVKPAQNTTRASADTNDHVA